MKIACLFDGAGLARLGLEQAGHVCTGFELDPWKHYLGTWVGSGNTILDDVRNINLKSYDAIWASPPCQKRSDLNNTGNVISSYGEDLLSWCLGLDKEIIWIENIHCKKVSSDNHWGVKYNAAQFTREPLQNRTRIIGGKFKEPLLYREYRQRFVGVCPTITATEYKGGALDNGRASRFYGRRLTIEECAYHQGFSIPKGWYIMPLEYPLNLTKWVNNIYEAIGNGVPVYMAKSFGEVYRDRFVRYNLKKR